MFCNDGFVSTSPFRIPAALPPVQKLPVESAQGPPFTGEGVLMEPVRQDSLAGDTLSFPVRQCASGTEKQASNDFAGESPGRSPTWEIQRLRRRVTLYWTPMTTVSDGIRAIAEGIMRRLNTFGLALLVSLSVTGLSHAQGIGGGIGSDVAGGISAGGLGGGGVGGNRNTAGGGGGGVAGSNAVQGLTGSRETALQSSGFLSQNALDGGGFMAAQGTNAGQGGGFGNAGGFNAGGRGAGGFGNAGGFGAAGGRGGIGGGRQPQTQRPTRIVRTRLSIAPDFGYRVIATDIVRSNLNQQFEAARQLASTTRSGVARESRALRGAMITASSIGRKVILQGQVATERDRLLAERMAKMEPGVDEVRNDLIVVPAR